MKKLFIEAINSNDIKSVRLFLSNELLLDPRGATFDEMLSYAEEHCENLYENYDSSFSIEKDSNMWNKKYMNDLKNEIDIHFVKDLVLHYREVTSAVLKEKIQTLAQEEREQQVPPPPIKKHTFEKIACGTLLVVGGTSLVVAGMVKAGTMCWTPQMTSTSSVVAGMVIAGIMCIIASGYFVYKIIKK